MSLYRISKKETNRCPLTDRSIIIDLDETLVHTSEDYSKLMALHPFEDPSMLNLRSRMYSLSLDSYDKLPTVWGVTRPYVEDFIPFCFAYFSTVCVWSAGSPEYVSKIVEYLFPVGYKPDVVYSRIHCHYTRDNVIFKPIEKMSSNERMEQSLRLDNTLFLDDLYDNFVKNPDNGILIPSYSPDGNYDMYMQEDTCLLDLMEWLMRPDVLRTKDVRSLDKHKIFAHSITLDSIVE